VRCRRGATGFRHAPEETESAPAWGMRRGRYVFVALAVSACAVLLAPFMFNRWCTHGDPLQAINVRVDAYRAVDAPALPDTATACTCAASSGAAPRAGPARCHHRATEVAGASVDPMPAPACLTRTTGSVCASGISGCIPAGKGPTLTVM